jgi:hypothetical protein
MSIPPTIPGSLNLDSLIVNNIILSKGRLLTTNIILSDSTGTLKITKPLNSNYKLILPTTIGSNNQFLTTDGIENTFWTTLTENYSRTEVNQNTYTIQDNDDIISVLYTTMGEVNLTLPKITGHKKFTITDEGGNASNNNIIINTNINDTIIGQLTYTINNNYNSITIYNNGINGWFIF